MNHVYRLLWNAAHGTYVPAPRTPPARASAPAPRPCSPSSSPAPAATPSPCPPTARSAWGKAASPAPKAA
ncbi:ESPR-type extended signal peptide-containing protein [Pseudomonas solani]|uniref:ESPR-type extended signal peptide-containing protein n=1 Tax=Pseudomonas solani TaxID=2731552 RepID=UPI003531745F